MRQYIPGMLDAYIAVHPIARVYDAHDKACMRTSMPRKSEKAKGRRTFGAPTIVLNSGVEGADRAATPPATAGGSVSAPVLQAAAAAGSDRREPSVALAGGQPPMQRKRGRPKKVSGMAVETEAQPESGPETEPQAADTWPRTMEGTEGPEDQGGELLRRSGKKRQTAMKLRTLEIFRSLWKRSRTVLTLLCSRGMPWTWSWLRLLLCKSRLLKASWGLG